MKNIFVILLGVLLAGSFNCASETTGTTGTPATSADRTHKVVAPDAIQWGDGPPGLPAGLKMGVLLGDPGKPGPFVLRARLPDGYRIMPHWHSIDENITVLQGTFLAAAGDTFDPAAMQPMTAGYFLHLPGRMHHYAAAKGDTIIQIHGDGPFDIHYLNPADDPRNSAGK
jgi:hypothetical protein